MGGHYRQVGRAYGFLVDFGFGWAVFATGHLLPAIGAAAQDDWFIPVLRYGGLGMLVISVINLIWTFSDERFG